MGIIIPPIVLGPCSGCIDLMPDSLFATMSIPNIGAAAGWITKQTYGIWAGVLSGIDFEGMCDITIHFCEGTGTGYNNAGIESIAWVRTLPEPAINGACGSDIAWGVGCGSAGGTTTGGCGYWVEA